MPRTIFAFNGDLESRLALHWLAHEQGYEVLAFSANLGQGIYLEPLGELALELGATAARVTDLRQTFLKDFCLPTLQADAIYQAGCFLGAALARYAIARELVRMAHEEGCRSVAHSAAGRGNDQVRMETALAAQDPQLDILAPVRQWPLQTTEERLTYARRRRLPIEEPKEGQVNVDRNLWGVCAAVDELVDSWSPPPSSVYQITREPESAPDKPVEIEIGFESGVPRKLNGETMELLPLVTALNRFGGEHGVGRNDLIEDRLFGMKSRQVYEAPAPTILLAAHEAVQTLVHSRELISLKDTLGQRYAEQVYGGNWFSDQRRSLQGFIVETQENVTGDVRLKLFKGKCTVVGRRSPYSLYDARMASDSNQEFFGRQWAQSTASPWILPARLAARQMKLLPEQSESGWTAP